MTATAPSHKWPSVPLSDLCDTTASTNPTSRPNEFFNYVDVSCVSNESFKIVGANRLQGKDAPSRARQLIEHEDVIFATVRPALRRVAMVPRELHGQVCSTGFCVLRAKRQNLSPEFLYFYLLSEPVRERVEALQTGATYPAINDGDLLRMVMPLPSVPEQRAIAYVLQTLQKAKEVRERELSLERERKAGLMEHLFTHGTRGEKTKATEIGCIPDSWSVSTLGELCEGKLGIIQTGPFGSQLHASDYVEKGVPVVNPTHLGFNSIDTQRVPKIPQKLADSLSKHYLVTGDILISRRGDFSRFAYIGPGESGWFCGTGCMLIRLKNPAIDNYFLALSMSLNATQAYLRNAAVGSIMPNLNTTILSQMPVLLPAIEEQREITSVLRACEMKVRALESEIPLAHELFVAMLAELMSNRISTEQLTKALNTQ